MDRGALELEDTVGQWFPGAPADKSGITVEDLLTHRSGLETVGWDPLAGDWTPMDRATAITSIFASRLRRGPATAFGYRNTNYILLAALLERAAGVDFAALMQREVFAPAGMQDSRIGWTSDSNLPMVRRFVAGRDRGSYVEQPRSWLRLGGGDLITSGRDLVRFIDALRSGRLVSPERLRAMWTIQAELDDGFGYGYGFWIREVDGRRVVFHGGDFNGYHNELRWYPDRQVLILVMLNSGLEDGGAQERVANHLVGLIKSDHSPLPPVEVRASVPASSFGRYGLPDGSALIVEPRHLGTWLIGSGTLASASLSGDDSGDNARLQLDLERSGRVLQALFAEDEAALRSELAPDVRSESAAFVDEWRALLAAHGSVVDAAVERWIDEGRLARTLVRLEHERERSTIGFTWAADGLIGTEPGASIVQLALPLARTGERAWIAWNWLEDRGIPIRWHGQPSAKPAFTIAAPDRVPLVAERID